MRFSLSVLAAAVSVSAHGGHDHDFHHQHPHQHHDHGHYHSDSMNAFNKDPIMEKASKNVEQMCAMDVARLCPSPDDWMKQIQPAMLERAPSDPVIDFLFNPIAPPPMMVDVTQVLDDMMRTAVTISEEPAFFSVIVFEEVPLTNNNNNNNEKPAGVAAAPMVPKSVAGSPMKETNSVPSPDDVFESMFSALTSKVATAHATPEAPSIMSPAALAARVAEYGQDILEKAPADDNRRSMARRLTEVGPETFERPHHVGHARLPFGCQKNRCIMSAYEENAVSTGCFRALKNFKESETALQRREALLTAMKAKSDSDAFFTFASLYFILAVGTIVLLRRRYGKFHKTMHEHRLMNERVIQAVYSNPEVKRLIESELKQEIGHVPPLPPHVLARMGGRRLFGHGFMICQFLKLMTFFCVLVLICVNPFLAMPLLCVFMLMRCCHLTCCAKDMPHELSCSCCCCGLSTDDVQSGLLTKEQECCTCCKGTGVCAPGCGACCGDDPCDCCHDGCDCCDGDEKDDKTAVTTIQVV